MFSGIGKVCVAFVIIATKETDRRIQTDTSKERDRQIETCRETETERHRKRERKADRHTERVRVTERLTQGQRKRQNVINALYQFYTLCPIHVFTAHACNHDMVIGVLFNYVVTQNVFMARITSHDAKQMGNVWNGGGGSRCHCGCYMSRLFPPL